jgi:undecaprenyl-diphosphatase
MAQTIAYWVGAHAIESIFILSAIILAVIFLLWGLFERHYKKLWKLMIVLWRWLQSLSLARRLYQRYPHVWSFLGENLSPIGYLVLYLGLGLLLSLVTFNIFSGIAEQVTEQAPLVEFDQTLATTLYENATPLEITFFGLVTNLAGRMATIVLGLGVGLVLAFRRQWLLLISWGVAILGNSLLNAFLKITFQRLRPEFAEPILVEEFWSFPSGHAMGAVLLYGMLTYFLVLLLNRYLEKVILVIMVTLVLLIGFSRLYLGVHFFSDVVAGYLIAAGWLAIVISGTEVARRRDEWLHLWRWPLLRRGRHSSQQMPSASSD